MNRRTNYIGKWWGVAHWGAVSRIQEWWRKVRGDEDEEDDEEEYDWEKEVPEGEDEEEYDWEKEVPEEEEEGRGGWQDERQAKSHQEL